MTASFKVISYHFILPLEKIALLLIEKNEQDSALVSKASPPLAKVSVLETSVWKYNSILRTMAGGEAWTGFA